jgi:peptide deformylase
VADEAGQIRTGDELDSQAQARRQLALAQIRQYPDPALRMKANEVTEFDASLRQLVERMSSLMIDARGVGLAATQVGILQRLFVFSPGEEEEVRPIVNPELVDRSDETNVDDEGCLSLQRVLVPVERSVRITLVGRDEHGADVRLELEGLAARVVQHEIDHLDGVLIVDKTSEDARREAMATLRAQLTLA